MASHHHHHHHQSNSNHHYNHQSNYPRNCCCCCDCTSSHLSPPPQPSMTETLLQAIATQLLESSQAHLYSRILKPHQQQQQQQQQQTQSLISSLLRRIDALESSLHCLSASPPPPTSLREVAARTIQIRFRAFLVRRSRTLRQLKDLASIKSSLNILKSSIADERHFKPEPVSQNAMKLLLKLDSIQGDDPMIKEGKRSISRELVRFLEFVDEISLRRRELFSKTRKNMVLSINRGDMFVGKRAVLVKAGDRVQGIRGFSRVSENEEVAKVELEAFHHDSDEENPTSPNDRNNRLFRFQNGVLVTGHDHSSKPKKSVRFADNENEQREFIDNLYKEAEEIVGVHRIFEDDEEHFEIEGSPQNTSAERNPRRDVKTTVNDGTTGHYGIQNGNFVFSAPEPVQMEPRTDLMKKTKIVRVSR